MWHNYAKYQREMCILAMLCLLHRIAQYSLDTTSYFLYKGYLKSHPSSLLNWQKRLSISMPKGCKGISSIYALQYSPFYTHPAKHPLLPISSCSSLTTVLSPLLPAYLPAPSAFLQHPSSSPTMCTSQPKELWYALSYHWETHNPKEL